MSLLRERHALGCTCSYCRPLEWHARGSFGFAVPVEKAHNAWWVFYYVGQQGKSYLRFTLPFLPAVVRAARPDPHKEKQK